MQDQEQQMREGHAVDKKFKKFFRITIPILVVEVIAAIVLVTYLILLPKNYCKVKTNVDYATVYIAQLYNEMDKELKWKEYVF